MLVRLTGFMPEQCIENNHKIMVEVLKNIYCGPQSQTWLSVGVLIFKKVLIFELGTSMLNLSWLSICQCSNFDYRVSHLSKFPHTPPYGQK